MSDYEDEDGIDGPFERAMARAMKEDAMKMKPRGNNFASQVLDGETRRVGCISKRYFAQQGDGAVVAHPTEAGKFRWLTVNEVRRLQGLPEGYFLGETKTTAGEVLGQGVNVSLFRQVIEGVR